MPFSACTQRTSFPDPLSNIAGAKKPLRPAVVIRRARLLSALGSSCEDTLRQLASAEDLCAQLAPSDVRVPESDLAEADRRIAEAARTTGLKAFTRPARSLRLAASAALPLLDEALQAGIAPADIGLIVGNTAAGTAETVSVLRSHPETEAPDKWMPRCRRAHCPPRRDFGARLLRFHCLHGWEQSHSGRRKAPSHRSSSGCCSGRNRR